ncbi:zinc-binding dehydrogenase, partial [Rhizobium sp. C1]|uniref:zinc-binding dehydrogenase n=1 Tax=Rhizobium sp. C1 TaxID=1349799 RepID=UPI001E6013B4
PCGISASTKLNCPDPRTDIASSPNRCKPSESHHPNFATVPFGLVASLGQPAGPIPPVPVAALSARAAALARPSVIAFINDPEAYAKASASVFDMMTQGVAGSIGGTYPLSEARRAHEDMEAGRTTGSLLLIPDASA